jgi:hypothetical protein
MSSTNNAAPRKRRVAASAASARIRAEARDTAADSDSTSADSNAPPLTLDVICIDESEEDLQAELDEAGDDEFKRDCVLWKAQSARDALEALPEEEKKKRRALKPKVALPTSMEMAAQLDIDWIGAIDPGTVNCAICIVSAKEARVVYWRVMHLAELCALCEQRTNIQLKASTTYSTDAMMHAIGWWCQQDDACPLKRCDLIVIERQSFSREMVQVQATWLTSFATHKPALVATCPITVPKTTALGEATEQSYVMYVPKAMSISSDSVKTKFRGFFPMIDEQPQSQPENSASTSKVRKRTYTSTFVKNRSGAFGVGDSRGDSAQYASNKANAKFWCRKLLGASVKNDSGRLAHRNDDVMSVTAADDFENAALETYCTMSVAQVAETQERLGGPKCDDLADAFFMAFYAADFIVGSLWKRAHGPLAKRHTTRYTYSEPPPSTMNSKASPEARHQTLFAYIKGRVKVSHHVLSEIVTALN